jgi:acyl carrier protein
MLNKNEVIEQTKTFITNNFLLSAGTCEILNSESLLEKGIIDSTGILELVNFIEDSFNIQVDDSELLPENFDSFDNVANYVMKKTNPN